MIQKFNQFINESASGAQNPLSIYDAINEPFTEFIERAQERLDTFREQITYLLNQMDKAIGDMMEDFDYAVVGEPIFNIASDLEEIEVQFHTNIPNNDEAWEADESPIQDFEHRLYKWFEEYKDIRTEIYYKPDEDGNAIVTLQMYVIDSNNFDSFTDALIKMGEDY
jgi:hypothetical protein